MNFLKKLQPGIETLKRLDVYSKPIEDFRVKTVSGGTASITCCCIILFLLAKRCCEFCYNDDTVETIFVDTSRSTKLRINIDFIIPAISCDYLALDAMDTSGEQHLHIEHNIFKRRLDLAGNPIEEPKREEAAGRIVLIECASTMKSNTCVNSITEQTKHTALVFINTQMFDKISVYLEKPIEWLTH